MKRRLSLLAVFVALVSSLDGARLVSRAAGADQTPALAPIQIDAIVTDSKDRPIRDLKPSDFELVDSGQSRPVEGAALEPGSSGRLIGVFLDEYHVQAGENTVRARAALTEFINSELGPQDLVAMMKPLDPLATIQITQDHAALGSAVKSFAGRMGDYSPRTPFEQNFMSRAPASADASRAQVVSSALQALALRIGGAREGRKAIIVVSEGFAPTLARGSDRLMGSLRAIVYAANRYQVAIYPIDPSRSDPPALTQASSALQSLAEQTGGEAAISQRDLLAAMKQALRDLQDYYLLTYHPARVGDGTFHAVQLRVARPGAQIRVRSGYWAANPELLKPMPVFTPRTPALAVRMPHASPLIRQWIGTWRAPDNSTTVAVTWERGALPPKNQAIASVVLKVTAEDGRVLYSAPIQSRASFDVAPGRYQIEMTIENEQGKALDSDYRIVDVPNLRVARATFSTPQIIRTRNAREFQQASTHLDVTPAAVRDFSRTERLLVRIPVYGPTGTTPSVSAILANRTGTPMRTLVEVPAELPPGLVQFDVPLSSLAPDDYRIELVTAPPGPQAKAVILFRVTN